jgi:hypothetical protein
MTLYFLTVSLIFVFEQMRSSSTHELLASQVSIEEGKEKIMIPVNSKH